MKKHNIILIIIIIAIGVLAYIFLAKPGKEKSEPAAAVSAPEYVPSGARLHSADSGNYAFDDGLKNPDSVRKYSLDEFGEGISSSEIFKADINGDGIPDRITREFFATGNAHSYYEYKIELNLGGQYKDITPENFRTAEGADCALQKLKFVFKPDFMVVKISREWEESWTTPTPASRIIYELKDNRLQAGAPQRLSKICNVSDLF
ncbi:MAG: hypothetical protein LBJ18_04755 [Rickettsiales bacterium]|jgi:hypothetical protein|nr:hypothetical protein [Rickettsiales bacterium]